VYAHLFPKNVGRLVLEAPVDPTQERLQNNLSQVKAVQLAFDRFAQHCTNTYDDCPAGSDPGQADQRVTELLDKLKKEPAPTGGGEKLDGGLAALAIANYLDLGEEGWAPLVKALSEVMERGTGGELLQKAYDHAPGARARPWAGVSARSKTSGGNGVSALVAITCADSNLRPGFTKSEEMIKQAKAASPVFGEALLSPPIDLCYHWPFKGERAAPDVSADDAPPILVVADTRRPDDAVRGRRAHGGRAGRGGRRPADGTGRGPRRLLPPTTAARPGPSTRTSSTARPLDTAPRARVRAPEHGLHSPVDWILLVLGCAVAALIGINKIIDGARAARRQWGAPPGRRPPPR
jgi:hypothetical protein